jgi:transcriptional regulator with PAS, ATPase and Fis domain
MEESSVAVINQNMSPPGFGFDVRQASSEVIIPERRDGLLTGDAVMVMSPDEGTPHALEEAYGGPVAFFPHASVGVSQCTFADIIGCSPALANIRELAWQAAQTGGSGLLTGEPGTGKELVARAIHAGSAHQQHPFVVADCATIPRERLEAELFGSPSGSIAGPAEPGVAGKFELAQEGTLFLKEIDALPLALQGRLLRVLQERQLIGPRGLPIRVGCMVMAATEQDLEALVMAGCFRRDLWYRLSVVHLNMPPLRERPEDIPLLVNYYWQRKNRELHLTAQLSAAAMRLFESYSWPGNVQEVIEVVDGVLRRYRGHVIAPRHLPDPLRTQAERFLVEQALRQAQNDRKKAAQWLGISPATLARKLRIYGLLRRDGAPTPRSGKIEPPGGPAHT